MAAHDASNISGGRPPFEAPPGDWFGGKARRGSKGFCVVFVLWLLDMSAFKIMGCVVALRVR